MTGACPNMRRRVFLMKKSLVIFGKMICILLLCICLGTGLIILAYSVPVERMEPQMRQARQIFEEEGAYPVLSDLCTSQLDNWSDANMILAAVYGGPEGAVEKAMTVRQYRVNGEGPVKSLIAYYDVAEQDKTISPWGRYWCGFLIILKPLFTFLGYGSIRILNLVLQTVLNVLIVCSLYRKGMGKAIVPYIIAIAFLMPLATAYCMFYSTVFYIFSVSSLIMIWKHDKWENTTKYIYVFLVIGALTSFMDYLSYPLVTFGIPMIFYLLACREERVRKVILQEFLLLFSWGMGYVGMWAGKWCVSSLILRTNTFKSAIGTILLRTSTSASDGSKFSLFEMLGRNIKLFVDTPALIVFILFEAALLAVIIKRREVRLLGINIMKFGLVAVLPFIWYVGASNHSYVHYFFTHKELVITSFAVMAMTVKTLAIKKEG